MSTSVGPFSPQSASQVDRGALYTSWTSPSNILTSNDSWATTIVTTSDLGCDHLIAYDFGINIPSDAWVTLLEVTLEAKSGYNSQSMYVGYDLDKTSYTHTAIATVTLMATEGTYYPTTTWAVGSGPRGSDVNSSNFAIGVYMGTYALAYGIWVDSISINLEYVSPAPRIQFIGLN